MILGRKMRVWGLILTTVLAVVAFAVPVLADKRVALVIGNSAYSNVSKLPNPASDAEAIGILFKRAGFDIVEQRQNLTNTEMRRVVRDFSEKVQNADVAVVFFAGHGIEVDGVNYLIPTDSRLERDVDVEDEAVSLDRVLKMIEPAKRLRLIILDACRDNPFGKAMKRTIAIRSIGRGLGPVEPSMSDTLIAFAAKAGSMATDGAGANSPFTAALLKYLVTPGLDVRLALGQVRDDVLKATGNKQEPFVYGSLGGAKVTLTAVTNDEQGPQRLNPNADVARDYEAAGKVGAKEAWDAFLAAYPSGFYADLARAQRAKLIAVLPPPTVVPKPPNLHEDNFDQPFRRRPSVAPKPPIAHERRAPVSPMDSRKKDKAQLNVIRAARNLQCCIATQRRLGTGDEDNCPRNWTYDDRWCR